MKTMKLTDLLADVPVLKVSGPDSVEISGLSYSSKKIEQGYLFAALKGEKADGADHVPEAVAKGAAAVLSERPAPEDFKGTWIQVQDAREKLALCSANFYDHPSRKLKMIGITGTKGKTTITFILEKILQKANFKPGVIGTIAYRGPGLDIKAERTTPEAPDIQRMLEEMASSGATHCLMEVSSHSLDLGRVEGIEFDVVVFTNLSGEHLDYHLNMEQYFEAKKKLFLPGHKNKMAVINVDDSWGKSLISQVTTGVITYGLIPSAFVRTEEYVFSENGIEATVKFPAGKLSFSSPLLGKPNLYNILASTAVALTLNLPTTAIIKGISSLTGVPGRFEKIDNSRGFHIFVDYAHSDDALKNLLETARELCKERVILVFGAGGDRDRSKRPRMGETAGLMADWSIITSDNPRSEDPLAIIAEVEQGIIKTGSSNYEIIPDRKKAIRKALDMGRKGDYILIAGKGHEDYQLIKDKVLHFDDAETVREILQERRGV